MVVVKTIAQNERYMSDIFDNEEKNLDNEEKRTVSYSSAMSILLPLIGEGEM